MNKRNLVILMMLLAACLIFGGCGNSDSGGTPATQEKTKTEPVQLDMVMFLPDIPPGNIFTHMFMDKVESISKGEVVINLKGGPEAIPPGDAPPAVKNGVIDIGNCIRSAYNSIVPGSSAAAVSEYSPAELRERGLVTYLQELFADHGIHYLGASSPSEPQQQACFYFKEPIDQISDFKGLKIATNGGLAKSFIEALGATPVAIGFGDYYTAMERGMVDGYYCGVPAIKDFGLEPVTGFMLDEKLSSCSASFLVNLDTWNSLSQSQKDVLTQAAIETEIEGAKEWNNIVSNVRDDITKAGVKIGKLSPEESQEFYKLYRESSINDEYKLGDKKTVDKVFEHTLNPDFKR